jgi:hypothetical protein
MLSPEEAKKRLDTLRDKDWRAKAERRIRNLPGYLQEPASAFTAPQPPGGVRDNKAEEHRQRRLAAARALDHMPDPDRAAVMAALHPGLGTALARWWADAPRRPYTRGWGRQAFRASDPALSVETRTFDLPRLLAVTGPYDADPAWLAIWGGYLGAGMGNPLGELLASAIDAGGTAADDALAALTEVGNGEHPVGIMGRHVIVALLGSSRPEGWDYVERLLLAAQRQEGLRQSILESADEGHPEAFRRLLDVVLDHKLLRFAAAVRAVGVWVGFGANVADTAPVEDWARKLAAFCKSETERTLALAGDDPHDVYLALCAGAMRDVTATLPGVRRLAAGPSADLRAVALRFAATTSLTAGQEIIAGALDDPDVGVASLAAALLTRSKVMSRPGVFDALTRLIERFPDKPRTVAGLGVEQADITIARAAVAARLVHALGDRPVTDLAAWLPVMNPQSRAQVASLAAGEADWGRAPRALTTADREILLGLLNDRSSYVRGISIKGLAKSPLPATEAPVIEALLTKNSSGLRRGALTLLASLPPDDALASAARLAGSRDERQRKAAIELRREIGITAGDSGGDAEVPAIEDLHVTFAVGRTAPRAPRRPGRLPKPGRRSGEVIAALDEIADRHRDTPVTISSWQGSQEMLFGDIRNFPGPFVGSYYASQAWPADDQRSVATGMVLGEVFRGWWADRPDALRGADEGLDALHAYLLETWGGSRAVPGLVPHAAGPARGGEWWQDAIGRLEGKAPDGLRQPAAVHHVTGWLLAEHASAAVVGECLDAFEATLAAAPPGALTTQRAGDPNTYYVRGLPATDWRTWIPGHPWASLLYELLRLRPDLFTADQLRRWYGLMRWVERPVPEAERLPVTDRLLTAAHEAGAASDADAATVFLDRHNPLFRDLTRRWRRDMEARYPDLAAVADRVRDRVVTVELRRGDLPTPTSRTAMNISSVHGVAVVADLLAALGDSALRRGSRYGGDSRADTFSHLLRVSFPRDGETGADLKAAAAEAGVPKTWLTDLAMYAPQWASLVEEALGWEGFADGVFWLHAHTRDTQWAVDQELRDSWAAMSAERTALSAADLLEGAVDVEWFRRVYGALGEFRWRVLHQAAKHASGGGGHKRAQLFAEAMLGQQEEAVLAARITGKRHQDSVRALGLLPLPDDPAASSQAVQRRYALLREFERGSKKSGSMRQASERTAVRIGVENLARTAGYADPLRFTWAMEAAEAGDLADGPVVMARDDVTLTLSVDPEGVADLTARRGSRALKAVPAALRKDPEVTAFQARKKSLVQQAVRVRQSLESAMTAQDAFTPDDFPELGRHPVVAPMLSQLVWVTAEGVTCSLRRAVKLGGPVRIAHPADMVADGTWVAWQERLFRQERRQPFKQVFREFYKLTDEEGKAGPESRRYDGHQVQPRQALALFGTRGWVTSYDSGGAARTFHRHGLVARVSFADGMFTPVESDLPTVDGVGFTRRGEYLLQPLHSVPPVVFSEAMRDLDLVVSVAHAGGVDPEASASTTEMRAALIRETARLMRLSNIEFAGDRHAVIRGTLGEYSLHLGSGTVHRRPGGALCIIPVGSQHRGRLFLPFADDDPKTAEIVSKALLLARDHEIKDPTILEQLRS